MEIEAPRGWTERVRLEPDGRLILPESVMAEYVIETSGCELWFNDKDKALGLRLLRGVEDPPCLIERLPAGPDGVQGVVAAGEFLAKVGCELPGETLICPCHYTVQYHLIHLLQVRVGTAPDADDRPSSGILDDFEPLDD
ncbi:MAG: hypothetical protein KKB20_25745 [Proteobacteria bacterium]|nr:hypothetical protein [Pseudomonadota bacterium]